MIKLNKDKVYLLGIFFVTLLGLFLRLICLDKFGGGWYDEVASYGIARQSFPMGIIDKLYNQDFHAPLYFFLLHFWIKFFGASEIITRSFSVLFGVLSIPMIYFAGVQFGSKKGGLLAASVFCISAFQIYYSQEIRFYILMGFLSIVSLYFLIKVNKNSTIGSHVGLALANLAIIYTYTIGCIFVLIQILVFAVYLYKKNKVALFELIKFQAIVVVLSLPYLPLLVHQTIMANRGIVNPAWWGKFTPFSIFSVFQDWFTPVLVNIKMHGAFYFKSLLFNISVEHGTYNVYLFLFWIVLNLIPSLIFIIGIINAFKKSWSLRVILSIGIFFLLFAVGMAYMDKLVLMSRYVIFSFPYIILPACIGLVRLRNKKISKVLITYILMINLCYIFGFNQSAPKLDRLDHYGVAARMLEKAKFGPNDMIIIPYGGRFFGSYYTKSRIFPFDSELTFVYGHPQYMDAVFGKDLSRVLNKKNAHGLLRYDILSSHVSGIFEEYILQEGINKLPKNGRMAVLLLRQRSMDPISDAIDKHDVVSVKHLIINKYYLYKKFPLFSFYNYYKTRHDFLEVCYKYLTPEYIQVSGAVNGVITSQEMELTPDTLNEITGVWELHVLRKK